MIKKTISVTQVTMETYQALIELGYEIVFTDPKDKYFIYFWQ